MFSDSAIVVADRMTDETGAVVGTAGYYLDLAATFVENRQFALDEALPDLFEARAMIEQAKGILMKTKGLDEQDAFRRLQKLARDANRKLVEIAQMVLAAEELLSSPPPPPAPPPAPNDQAPNPNDQ